MAQNYVYRDVNSRVGVLDSPTLIDNFDAVLNAVLNILGTEVGEREFLPEFGSTLSQFLFNPIHEDTAFQIRYALMKAIERWEPRVTINQRASRVIPDIDMQGYRVTLAVRIKGISTDQQYNLFLKSYFGTQP